jgi:hypothetical protein
LDKTGQEFGRDEYRESVCLCEKLRNGSEAGIIVECFCLKKRFLSFPGFRRIFIAVSRDRWEGTAAAKQVSRSRSKEEVHG